ncbi:TetR family transcriptional regulator [Sphingomonas naphthae]|uniref:TetR family transcriptional regulator n=1 Tax=Sphingomonas naphthae TaxID=1813468 RepID=A0ABY7TG22_9SPHN|nr:TetR family transcriptional regulator [Sphingomonas naphthae]WCT72182.1 TetR family transcriptional regulator [Sphingomonas naphthae]
MRDLSERPLTLPQRKQDAREALLQAGSELMSERDEIDIPLSDIAARASVNSALVKYYFGNKDGFLLALLDRDVGTAIRDLNLLQAGPESATRKLTTHLSGIIRVYQRYPYINRLIRGAFNRVDAEAQKEVARRVVLPIRNFYRTILEEGHRNGEFRKIDPNLFYLTTIGACDQLFSSRGVLPHLQPDVSIDELRREYTDHVVALILQGISATTSAD